MSHAISPLAPKTFVDMPVIEGVRMATAEAGIKYKNRTDVLLMVFDDAAAVAGVFTRSKCPSAPVDFCRANLSHGKAKAVIVNSGNANAFTGKKGRAATEMTAQSAGDTLAAAQNEIYLASTGVIGEPLDAAKIAAVLPDLASRVTGDFWLEAAKAIMTTDTYPKVATRTASIGGVSVTINGIAKGAGMIAPDMATMLSYVVTDADLPSSVLQVLLSRGVGPSFNSVTVDSDTSTSDTLMLFATAAAAKRGQKSVADPSAPELAEFAAALDSLLLDLAHQVVCDGEGARKMVEVTVKGAISDESAKKVALSIANSPLVKTAVAGEDANWGRIVMAVGKSGEPADRDLLEISFGSVRVAVNGERDAEYSEADATAVMKNDRIPVLVNLGLGSGQATVWTCDLTKEYVEINGDYRS
jgi:glutamate N-acetyltransferase/amino-acid N-acetyltransferase